MVKNNSPDICLPVEKTKEICKEYNLQFVKTESIMGLGTYEQVLKHLGAWSKSIGEG
jgi:hypothetical protein